MGLLTKESEALNSSSTVHLITRTISIALRTNFLSFVWTQAQQCLHAWNSEELTSLVTRGQQPRPWKTSTRSIKRANISKLQRILDTSLAKTRNRAPSLL